MFIGEAPPVVSEFTRIQWGKEIKYKRSRQAFFLKCDGCGGEFMRVGELSPDRRNNDFSHYCPGCPAQKLAGAKGLETKRQNSKHLIGTRRLLERRNYPQIYVGHEYTYYKGRGDGYWMDEHVYTMSELLQASISKGMVVHHIDNDKMNNDIDNLHLCTIDEHNKCHGRIETSIFKLVQVGLMTFNKDTMDYEFSEVLTYILEKIT